MGLGSDGKQHKGHTNKEGLRQTVYSYLDTPLESRLELKKWLKLHKMRQRTFFQLEGVYNVEKKALTKVDKTVQKLTLQNTVLDAWTRLEGKEPPERIRGVAVMDITNEEKMALARKIYQDAMAPDAPTNVKDLAVRMLGMLIERKEATVRILDGAAIITAITEAERERANQGSMEVQKRLSPLPPELHLDSGQSASKDS